MIDVLVVSGSVDLEFDQRLASGILENALNPLRDLLSRLEIVGVQLGLDASQFFQGSLKLATAGGCILLNLLGATDPVQTVAVRSFVITLGQVVAVCLRIGLAIVLAG